MVIPCGILFYILSDFSVVHFNAKLPSFSKDINLIQQTDSDNNSITIWGSVVINNSRNFYTRTPVELLRTDNLKHIWINLEYFYAYIRPETDVPHRRSNKLCTLISKKCVENYFDFPNNEKRCFCVGSGLTVYSALHRTFKIHHNWIRYQI